MEKLLSAIIGATILVMLYGSARLWFTAIERVCRGEAIVPFKPRRPVPWGLVDMLLIFLLVIFTVSGAHRVATIYADIPLDGGFEKFEPHQLAALIFASSLATLLSCLASLALVQIRAGATRQDLGLVAAQFLGDVKLGAEAFVMLAPPMYLLQFGLVQIWPYEHPVQDLLERQTDVSMLLVTLFTAVAVAPFAEEMFFRVLLQGWLENISVLMRKVLRLLLATGEVASDDLERDWRAAMIGDRTGVAFLDAPAVIDNLSATMGTALFDPPPPALDDGNPYASPQAETTLPPPDDATATDQPAKPGLREFRPAHYPIVVSAAIFALLHLGQGPAPIPLFFLAIGLGYLYRQTHRATPSIVVHLLINSLSMAALWVGLVFKS